jgi:hypothetical protein
MTQTEVSKINDLISKMQIMDKSFRDLIQSQNLVIENLNKKVEAKQAPLNFETSILQVVQQSMDSSIKTVLTGYNSPLIALVTSVVNEHAVQLKSIISSSFNEVIAKDEFKQSIVNAFSHKVARSIISNNDGLFDKVGNELKQDAVFKSKMALAVANVVEELLNERRID